VESRKRDSNHDFSSGLAWEKESKEGNAFRALEPSVGDQGRRTAARCGTVATVSKRHGGKGRGKGKTSQ
jgi:hypothetical protein